MKKKGYYEYDPVIYPRRLCVAIGMNQEDANKCFEGRNGEALKYDFTNASGVVYDSLRRKVDKKICSLAIFPDKASRLWALVAMRQVMYVMLSKTILI